MPAQFVKPFVKSNKNDFIDAEAIAEAVERKNMRFVSIKTDDRRTDGGSAPAASLKARGWSAHLGYFSKLT
jgi:hypothetical protein